MVEPKRNHHAVGLRFWYDGYTTFGFRALRQKGLGSWDFKCVRALREGFATFATVLSFFCRITQDAGKPMDLYRPSIRWFVNNSGWKG